MTTSMPKSPGTDDLIRPRAEREKSRSGIAGIVMAVLGLAFILVVFTLSRVVLAQFDGVPRTDDVNTAESGWFNYVSLFGMIPLVVLGFGAAVSARVTLMSSRDGTGRVLACATIAILVLGVPFALAGFQLWLASGWRQ